MKLNILGEYRSFALYIYDAIKSESKNYDEVLSGMNAVEEELIFHKAEAGIGLRKELREIFDEDIGRIPVDPANL